MRRTIRLLIFAVILFSPLAQMRAGGPDSAKTILDAALRDAGASHRTVFLIFHASWCSWCKKLDAVLEAPDVKKVIARDYVVVRLDVLERGDKVGALENPGGRKVMGDLGGSSSGLPFYAFLESSGKKTADSMIEGPKMENIGYPGSDDEIALFGRLLKETSHRMTDDERAFVLSHFQKQGS
jgi:hypothetical protein